MTVSTPTDPTDVPGWALVENHQQKQGWAPREYLKPWSYWTPGPLMTPTKGKESDPPQPPAPSLVSLKKRATITTPRLAKSVDEISVTVGMEVEIVSPARLPNGGPKLWWWNVSVTSRQGYGLKGQVPDECLGIFEPTEANIWSILYPHTMHVSPVQPVTQQQQQQQQQHWQTAGQLAPGVPLVYPPRAEPRRKSKPKWRGKTPPPHLMAMGQIPYSSRKNTEGSWTA